VGRIVIDPAFVYGVPHCRVRSSHIEDESPGKEEKAPSVIFASFEGLAFYIVTEAAKVSIPYIQATAMGVKESFMILQGFTSYLTSFPCSSRRLIPYNRDDLVNQAAQLRGFENHWRLCLVALVLIPCSVNPDHNLEQTSANWMI